MSEPETSLPVTVLPGTLLSTRMPAAWTSEIGSGPQPRSMHTAPDTVFPVTCAVALRRTRIAYGAVGYCTTPGVTTLFANVTSVVVAPNGGYGATAIRPLSRKPSTTTPATRPLALVPRCPSMMARSYRPNCTP